MHNVQRCLNQVAHIDQFCKGMATSAATNASVTAQNFQTITGQVVTQNKVLAELRGSNEKLQAQNAKLEAKLGGMEVLLKSVLEKVGQTSQMVAHTQFQSQQVLGWVMGMGSGLSQVQAQVGGLGLELQQQKAPAHMFPLLLMPVSTCSPCACSPRQDLAGGACSA